MSAGRDRGRARRHYLRASNVELVQRLLTAEKAYADMENRWMQTADEDVREVIMEVPASCLICWCAPTMGDEHPVERVWTTKRGYVNVMTLMDVYYHLDEADHVVRMLMPDRQFF